MDLELLYEINQRPLEGVWNAGLKAGSGLCRHHTIITKGEGEYYEKS